MQGVFQKIIENLDKASDYYECEEQGREHVRMVDLTDAIEIVKQAVAEYNNGWIPCSKRLPEPGKIVMVCQMYSWKNFEEGAMVTIGRLRPVEKDRIPYWEFQHYRPDFKHGTIMDNGIICPGSKYVIAWKPLPEPYQPKGE